jgi:phosphatidylserine/phosphatidylglycerophosphate/cardiolipin synthase-like enzyme
LIDSAHHNIDIYNEEMDDPAVTDALAAAARRGVNVKIVMTADSEWDSAFAQLTAAGAHVHTFAPDASIYIHAKMILVDAQTAFLGSQNFSPTSLNDNREHGITLTDRPILASLTSTFDSDYTHATPNRTQGSPGGGPSAETSSCSVHASYSTSYGDWNVDVSGAPANTGISATADGITDSWHTDASGYGDIYLKAPASDEGASIKVTAGSVTCSGTL